MNTCLSLLVAVSMHMGLEGNYNGIHPHARCQIDNTITGIFYNSEESFSIYAGKEFDIDKYVKLEIGIATGKLHARGPVGAAQLTSFKYLVEGQGTTRD